MARHGHCLQAPQQQQQHCPWRQSLIFWAIVLLASSCLQACHADSVDIPLQSAHWDEQPLQQQYSAPPLVSHLVHNSPFVVDNEVAGVNKPISSSQQQGQEHPSTYFANLHSSQWLQQAVQQQKRQEQLLQPGDQLQKRQLSSNSNAPASPSGSPGAVRPFSGVSSSTSSALLDEKKDDVMSNEDTRAVSVTGNRPPARAAPQALPQMASWVCSSSSAQGPDWNGTFQSNSEGNYPGGARTCTWTIKAINDTLGSYVISLGFTNSFSLVCGMDSLALYDGDNMGAPQIAKLCGNIWHSRTQRFYSSGTTMTAVLTIHPESPGSLGFTAVWSSVNRCDVCVGSGTGTCNNFRCQCNNKREGPVCERETAGSKDFVPRSQHSMAYDADKDMVYITGGVDLSGKLLWDMVTYTFSNNKWDTISTARAPRPRYGHCSFMYNGNLYIFGGMQSLSTAADIWVFNGKTWVEEQPINRDKQPGGTIGASCVMVRSSNATILYVFGGTDKDGRISAELTTYNFEKTKWEQGYHANGAPLSGATGIYHNTTDSIYFFGGTTNLTTSMNQTTRNVIPYQYAIHEDLWYALAPRVDPLTNQPILPAPVTGSATGPSLDIVPPDDDDDEDDEDGDEQRPNATSTFYPPVMYDHVSSVWAPAGLAGNDYVVMFGGMIPYGPGVRLNEYNQRCFSQSLVVYDLNCQKWTTYDDVFVNGMRLRANHSMVIRAPGSAGGSKTNWTAFIFGGFDGQDHNDMLNITIPLGDQNPGMINSCRALRWCSMYDDCVYCHKKNYCSYVNGLCLFDKDKAKNGLYLAGGTGDEPQTGTFQNLMQQRPELRQLVKNDGGCSVPQNIPLSSNTDTVVIDPGETFKFSSYINEPTSDILFEIKTQPLKDLEFETLNVWEGFINMYWRADHELTDDTWNGNSSYNPLDPPVITGQGTLNTSELYNRWMGYSGLDDDQAMSALRSNKSLIRFYANDPRRFTGNYVYSLRNPHDIPVRVQIYVTPQEHSLPDSNDKGDGFNMAMLAVFMAGFILAVVLLVILARKIRRLIEERDQSHQAAEMLRAMEDDDDDQTNGHGLGGRGGATAIEMNGLRLRKKPLYRVVIGVQNLTEDGVGLVKSAASRYQRKKTSQAACKDDMATQSMLPTRSASTSSLQRHKKVVQVGRTKTEPTVSFERLSMTEDGNVEGLAIKDEDGDQEPARDGKGSVVEMLTRSLSRRLSRSTPPRREDEFGIAREDLPLQHSHDTSSGWSLRSVERMASLRRTRGENRIRKEEKEGLTSNGDDSKNGSESDLEVVDLNQLSGAPPPPPPRPVIPVRPSRRSTALVTDDSDRFYRRRNPAKVQPISIEPIPFHGGLVPRTHANLQRYQRHLQRQQAYEERIQRSLQPTAPPSIASSTRTTTTTNTMRQASVSPAPQQSTASLHSTSSFKSLSHSLSRTLLRARANTSTHEEGRGPRVSFETIGGGGGGGGSPTSPATAASTVATDKEEIKRRLRQTKSSDSLGQVRRAASIMSSRNYPVARHDSARLAPTLPEPSSLFGVGTREAHSYFPGSQQQSASVTDETNTEMNNLDGVSQLETAKNTAGANLPPHPRITSSSGMEKVRIPRKSERGEELAILKQSSNKHQRQEFEPGPLVGVNILIVFPGDEGSRRVMHQGELLARQRAKKLHQSQQSSQQHSDISSIMDDTLYDSERRLPPMAIGTTFLPDPVRWWAHRAYQHKQQRRQARQAQKTL